jgi:hypothetical protein
VLTASQLFVVKCARHRIGECDIKIYGVTNLITIGGNPNHKIGVWGRGLLAIFAFVSWSYHFSEAIGI